MLQNVLLRAAPASSKEYTGDVWSSDDPLRVFCVSALDYLCSVQHFSFKIIFFLKSMFLIHLDIYG